MTSALEKVASQRGLNQNNNRKKKKEREKDIFNASFFSD
jgi:hypothetical protein